MKTVCLVACVSKKGRDRVAAKDLYVSPLFLGARDYATSRCDDWRILSAKYGLLRPDEMIEPYEQTLNAMAIEARLRWADKVFRTILGTIEPGSILAFVAGNRYREHLLERLTEQGYIIRVPLERLPIGKQLSWFKKLEDSRERLRHLDEFYRLLRKLEQGCGKRVLGECTGRLEWPNMGVYFFFEPKEYRTSKVAQDRVVRVGTHTVSRGSSSTFWTRLRTHRGGMDGTGNHRASIFRLHVGAALMAQSSGRIVSQTWGIGQTATTSVRAEETEIEREVSEYIGAMSLQWLSIGDEAGPMSDRAFIEQNAIALLAGTDGPIDLPTAEWLGRHSAREAIRKSGLWNVNYVDAEYDPRFLETMAEYVDVTVGSRPAPIGPLAPRDWVTTKRNRINSQQRVLFESQE